MAFVTNNNVSLVTAILPQEIANRVIDAVFQQGERKALIIDARGTLMRDRWYQALIPMVSPEREFIQFLVPDLEVDRFMRGIVTTANLHLPGAGAVYAVPCDEVVHTADYELWARSDWESDTFDASKVLKENLTAIFCIMQKGSTEAVSRAAMQAGAHGPIVFYCEGSGLRDRLGWLRITKNNEKEVLVAVVDNADAIAVTEAMVDAGDIDLPGRGFLYRVPIQKGIVNIGSTIGRHRYTATLHQVISAIDELKGGADWRDQRVNELVGTGQSAGLNLFGKVRERVYLRNQCALNCIIGRRHIDTLVDAALAAGAPGANFSIAKIFESDDRATVAGVRYHRERGVVRFILGTRQLTAVTSALTAVCEAQAISDVCFYVTPVTRAITYVADPSHPDATTNRLPAGRA